MKVIDAIARILRIEGAEYLSAYPTTPLIEAAAKVDIRPVLCRQERVGVGIADGYARVTNGRPLAAFCMQYGPGAENAFPGVATAYSDSTPMLLLPLGHPRDRAQVFPLFSSARTYASVTKSVETITMAQPGRGRHAARHQPHAHGSSGTDDGRDPRRPRERGGARRARSRPIGPSGTTTAGANARDVDAAARVLRAARRPVIHAGQGVLYAEACERPARARRAARGARHDHDGSQGRVPGRSPARPRDRRPRRARPLARTSSATPTWSSASGAASRATAWRRASPRARRSSTPPTTSAISTRATPPIIRCWATRGSSCVSSSKRSRAREAARRGERGRAPSSSVSGQRGSASGRRRSAPTRCRSIRTGSWPSSCAWSTPARRSSRTTRAARAISSCPSTAPVSPRGYLGWGKSHALGTGLGLIIGAKLAAPDKFCVNFMGDAAFGMTGLDFETAVRCGIPILTVVLNNSSMAIEIPHLVVSHDKYRTRDIGRELRGPRAGHGRLERARRAPRRHRGRLRARAKGHRERAGGAARSSSRARRRASRIEARSGRRPGNPERRRAPAGAGAVLRTVALRQAPGRF